MADVADVNYSDEDGEDVVFEGSQLHQHFVETGFIEDLEIVRPSDRACHPSEILSLPRTPHTYFSRIVNIFSLRTIQHYGNKVLRPLTCLFKDDGKQSRFLKEVWGCPLLLEEDKKWIAFADGGFTVAETSEANYSPEFWTDFWSSGLGSLLSEAGKVVLVASCIEWCRNYNNYLENLRKLQYLVQKLSFFTKEVKKALRLVKNREAIDRGYMMSFTGGSFLDENTSKTLPALREVLAQVTLRANTLISEATRQFRDMHPLSGRLDDACHYIALTACGDSDNVVKDSVRQLKKNTVLLSALQSEMLRRLAFCFCPGSWADQDNSSTNKQVFTICYNLAEELSDLKDTLETEYMFAYHVFLPGDPEPVKEDKFEAPRYREIAVSIYSAAVHTKVLSEALLIGETLANSAAYDVETSLADIISEKCVAAKNSLRAVENCLSITELHIAKLKQAYGPRDSTEVVANIDDTVPAQASALVPVGISDLNVCAEDLEVFEAMSLCEVGNGVPHGDDEEVAANLRVEKEISRRLYGELRDVLSARAREMSEREARTKGLDIEAMFQRNDDKPVECVFPGLDKTENRSMVSEYLADVEDFGEEGDTPAPGNWWPFPLLQIHSQEARCKEEGSENSSSSYQARPRRRITGDSNLTDAQWLAEQIRINRLDEEDYILDPEDPEDTD